MTWEGYEGLNLPSRFLLQPLPSGHQVDQRLVWEEEIEAQRGPATCPRLLSTQG